MRIEKRLILMAKFLPLTAIVAAIALAVFLLSSGNGSTQKTQAAMSSGNDSSQKAQAANVSAATDFSITTAGCDSNGPTVKCVEPVGVNFTVSLHLNTQAIAWAGYDAHIDWTAGLSYVNGCSGAPPAAGCTNAAAKLYNSLDESPWPGCAFGTDEGAFLPLLPGYPLADTGGNQPGPATALWACADSNGADQKFLGTLATLQFVCNTATVPGSPATLTLINDAGQTDIFGATGSSFEAGTDVLSINCLAATSTPTQTPTITPTPTKTPTLTATPSLTRTPTISPTMTRTPTATPLPSDLPDVTITKTDSPDPVDANGILTYDLQVKNLGLLPANGVLVGDQLPVEPNGVVFISATASDDSPCFYTLETNLVLCKLTDPLPAGGQMKIIIVVRAPTPSKQKGDIRISNFASVIALNEPFFNQGNNKDKEETVVLAPRADLTLTKTDAPDPVDSGGTVVYTLTVKNVGPQKATNVLIKENLPDGSTFLPSPDRPECTVPVGAPILNDPDVGSVDVQCDLGASFVGEKTVYIWITAPQEHRDTVIKNIAFVTGGNELFSQTGNNLAVQNTAVLAPPPDVALVKSGPAKVRRTQKLSYTLTVTNIGFGDAFNVVVSDILPKYILGVSQPMTLQSVTGASCGALVSQQFSCTIPKLPGSGGQVIITVTVRAPTVVTNVLLTNQASATDPGEPGDPSGNNSSGCPLCSQNTTIQACFDVTGDGVVTVADILAVIHRFSAHTGNPNYDLLFDINGDGAITVADILYVIQHYSQHCV